MKVKICGLTRRQDVEVAVDSGADYVGFVVGFPSTPRNLTLEKAGELLTHASGVEEVVVAPAHDHKLLERVVKELHPGVIQLHGPFTERSKSKVLDGVFTARSISTSDSSTSVAAVKASALYDMIHLDSSTSQGIGGRGVVHNWQISAKIRHMVEPKLLVLAGGLNPMNVAEAVRIVRPFCVDSSSGVESSLGVKDDEKVRLFINNAHEVNVV